MTQQQIDDDNRTKKDKTKYGQIETHKDDEPDGKMQTRNQQERRKHKTKTKRTQQSSSPESPTNTNANESQQNVDHPEHSPFQLSNTHSLNSS